METFEKGIDYLVRILRIIGGFSLAAMMTLTCIDVVMRAFGHPIFGSIDIIQFLAVLVLAAAMPYTQVQRGHVGVSLLVDKMGERGQAIVDMITHLVSLVVFAIVSWEMALYAKELWDKGEVSMTIEIPKYPFLYLVAVCFGILCLVLLVDAVNFWRKAVKG